MFGEPPRFLMLPQQTCLRPNSMTGSEIIQIRARNSRTHERVLENLPETHLRCSVAFVCIPVQRQVLRLPRFRLGSAFCWQKPSPHQPFQVSNERLISTGPTGESTSSDEVIHLGIVGFSIEPCGPAGDREPIIPREQRIGGTQAMGSGTGPAIVCGAAHHPGANCVEFHIAERVLQVAFTEHAGERTLLPKVSRQRIFLIEVIHVGGVTPMENPMDGVVTSRRATK